MVYYYQEVVFFSLLRGQKQTQQPYNLHEPTTLLDPSRNTQLTCKLKHGLQSQGTSQDTKPVPAKKKGSNLAAAKACHKCSLFSSIPFTCRGPKNSEVGMSTSCRQAQPTIGALIIRI